MKRPTCGLCQRIGNVCTFPTKRKAPDSRKLSAGRQTRRFSDNFGQFESLTHAETDLLDRLIALLQAQSSSSEKLEDYLAAYSRSSAETHSPIMSVSPISSGEKGPTNENTSLPSATGAGSRLSTQLSTNASASTAKPVANAKVSLAIPQAVSAGLIEAFFENIQPWLPMLHRPRFLARYADLSKSCSDGLQGLPVDEALLLYGIFALAARFSSSEFFGDIPPIQRGDRFAEEAESLYEQARAISTPTLTYLQGCILLAFYYYTSKPCPHSWILTGVCVRIAYELDLAEIDADEIQNLTPAAWVEKEEMRRAWWLVWELDTFGSTMSNRPYTIDRRRMAVMFPVSDEAWFSETPQSSLKLNTCPGMSWKSLSGGGKLDERAWFLFANYLMSLTLDMSQRKDGVSADEKLTLENEISCFKLSLPTSFRLDTEVLPFDAQSFARSNWIIGTNLMLMTTSVFLSSIKVAEPSHCSHDDPALDTTLPLRIRAMELSRIVTRWSPGYISLSHPFFAASTILPVHLSESSFAISQPTIASSQELGKRLLAQFGQVWKLGSVLLRKSEHNTGMMCANKGKNLRRFLKPPGRFLRKSYVWLAALLSSSLSQSRVLISPM
jgi:hypothetical protein